MDEFDRRKLYYASYQYHLICQPNNWHITKNGDIKISCPNNTMTEKYNIKEKTIFPQRIRCNDNYCQCSMGAYKELIVKKRTIKVDNV